MKASYFMCVAMYIWSTQNQLSKTVQQVQPRRNHTTKQQTLDSLSSLELLRSCLPCCELQSRGKMEAGQGEPGQERLFVAYVRLLVT
jgi:hypothetical protein